MIYFITLVINYTILIAIKTKNTLIGDNSVIYWYVYDRYFVVFNSLYDSAGAVVYYGRVGGDSEVDTHIFF